MKNPFYIIVVFIITSLQIINAQNINLVNNYDSKITSKDIYYYIPNDKDFIEGKPYITFKNSVDSYISKKGTEISIFSNNIIFGKHRWYRMSNVVPGDNNLYLAFKQFESYKFFKPKYLKYNNPYIVDAQIRFKIGYQLITKDAPDEVGPWRLSYKKENDKKSKCYFSSLYEEDPNDCIGKTFRRWELDYHKNSLNYKIFWCGDGVLNSPNGIEYSNGNFQEDCDPNDPNKKKWGKYGCSKKCRIQN